MSTKNLTNVKIVQIVRTTSAWEAETTVPSAGVLCFENTGTEIKAKLGDGVKKFFDMETPANSLPYVTTDLTAYATKTYVDNKVSTAISALGTTITFKGIKTSFAELPNDAKPGDLWFVRNENAAGADQYEEYVFVKPEETEPGRYEFMGAIQTVNLEGFLTTEAFDEFLDDTTGDFGKLKGRVTNLEAAIEKLDEDAEPNVINEIKVNGTKVDPVEKVVSITVPKKIADMEDKDDFKLTDTVYDLTSSKNSASGATITLSSSDDEEDDDVISINATGIAKVTTNAQGAINVDVSKVATANTLVGGEPVAGENGLMTADDKTALNEIAAHYVSDADTIVIECSL